jgi:hypothetical protein
MDHFPFFFLCSPTAERNPLCFEGSRASTARPSDKSSVKMNMSVDPWWDNTERGNGSTWAVTSPIVTLPAENLLGTCQGM